jgi:hypothetical protein
MSWVKDAACRGVDADGGTTFHPNVATNSDGGRAAKAAYETARTWCRRCPVTVECLTEALGIETNSTAHGVWGGLSPRQRNQLRPGDDLRSAIASALEPDLPMDDTYSPGETRAALAAYERHKKGRGPALTEDQVKACRAHHRARAKRARDKRKAEAQ